MMLHMPHVNNIHYEHSNLMKVKHPDKVHLDKESFMDYE